MSKLPEWPIGGVPVHGSLAAVICKEREAAIARLRAVEPYMNHLASCPALSAPYPRVCECGLYDLLADLEPPRSET